MSTYVCKLVLVVVLINAFMVGTEDVEVAMASMKGYMILVRWFLIVFRQVVISSSEYI